MIEMTLVCTACSQQKPITEFPFRDATKGIRRRRCRDCLQQYQRQWYIENGLHHRALNRRARRARYEVNRQLVDAAKQNPCTDCGGQFPPEAMDFDHVRDDKVREVGNLLWHASPERVLAEIAKCEVVCASCHRIRTRRRVS